MALWSTFSEHTRRWHCLSCRQLNNEPVVEKIFLMRLLILALSDCTGIARAVDKVYRMALSNLEGEYAKVTSTNRLLNDL